MWRDFYVTVRVDCGNMLEYRKTALCIACMCRCDNRCILLLEVNSRWTGLYRCCIAMRKQCGSRSGLCLGSPRHCFNIKRDALSRAKRAAF